VASAHRELSFPPLPASIPPAIVQFIAELTAKDPAARPESAKTAAWRAAQLRDQLTGGPATAHEPQPWAPVGWAPATPAPAPSRGAGTNHPTLVTELPAAELDQLSPPRRRRAGLVAAAVVALAIAITAGVAFAQRGGSGPTRKPVAVAHASAPAVRLVDVQRSALIGQPTQVAVQQLRAKGFRVQVQLDPTFSQRPGEVVAVHPAGPQPAGSLVTIVSSTWPGGFGFGHHHHHHFGGNGNGGNGNGGGGQGGNDANNSDGNGFIGNVLGG
jgi:eukaryotic-like serine/threonine-protein kinase